jgi:hypothetical protein
MAAALTMAAMGFSAPAYAAVTFSSYSGPDLSTKIKASTTNTANDTAQVYGSTLLNGASADVQFTGLRANQITTEAIHITDGAGFASITDAPGNATNQLYNLIIDVTSADFNQYMFSIQLVTDGTITVQYLLAGGGSWTLASPTGGIFQAANANNTYVLQGGTFTQIMVSSTSAFKEFKQNSITLGSVPAPLPEPATWGLMLLGFGGMGMALRRGRRRSQPTLMQIA